MPSPDWPIFDTPRYLFIYQFIIFAFKLPSSLTPSLIYYVLSPVFHLFCMLAHSHLLVILTCAVYAYSCTKIFHTLLNHLQLLHLNFLVGLASFCIIFIYFLFFFHINIFNINHFHTFFKSCIIFAMNCIGEWL